MIPPLYKGRRKIVIPVSVKQFNENPSVFVLSYLGNCLATNGKNVKEIKALYEIYRGEHDIRHKQRLDGSAENNNILTINHIFRQVEFKKGFMVGNPIEYALSTAIETDDMTYLNKYLKDSLKASKDIDKYEQMYVGGLAHQFIIPKTTDYEYGNEAPFELCNMEIGQGFVVYSSDITNTPLFNVTISERLVDIKNNKTIKVYDIYYIKESDKYCYNFTVINNNGKYVIENGLEYKQPYKFLPIIEYTLNSSRMGIAELVVAIQNGLNAIHSNQIDDIIDFVNAYIVFENQNIDKKFAKTFQELKKMRVIAIKSNNPQLPARVSILKQSLNHTDINSFYELLKNEMYDIVGCPQSSGNVTSGGDTGSARLLGNGWETAQNQAQVDTSYIQQFEYELLKKIISICKTSPNSNIDNIYANDIEIKYSINMSNNLLVKAQALKNLYDMNMPYEEALAMTGITGDTHGVGIKWRENDDKVFQEENQIEQEKEKNIPIMK